ncbi:MAG: FtsX-like permease family protein [Eubacteriales bacterium]|nr:FtsX-like permease family protein [Eubacteriales bacterium]
MKSYLSLVPISARVHRRQSRMTRICIILAVFLVTALFSITDMWLGSETDAMIAKHGNYHIVLQDVPQAEAEWIGGRSDVAVATWVGEINPDAQQEYNIEDRKAVLYGCEESYISNIRNYHTEGNFPQNDHEIMLSADAKKLFSIGVGDEMILHTPAGDVSYTVSGFCEDDTEFNSDIDGCCGYMDETAWEKLRSINGETETPNYYIQFTEDTNIQQVIANIKEQYGLTDENIDENTAVLGLLGASSNESVKNIYPLVMICFLLILASGVLMISGCINSNVAQRTNFFGMLRCIGASKKQIMRYVRLEALNWCITAIPMGCLLGVVVSWILAAILRFVVKGEWAYMPLFAVSVVGIVCGVAIGIVTVFIAAHAPAKRAAKVSPVAAVSGNTETVKHERHAAGTRFFRIETSLGIHHAVSARKNLILISGSFALTIILLLIFSACLDVTRRLVPSTSDFTPDITISSPENTNSIGKKLAVQIDELPGVEHAFGTMYNIACPAKINGTEQAIDLVSYEDFMLNSSEKSVASGDLSKIYGDSHYAMAIFSQDSHLDVGDRIQIGDEELEIACVVSEGIGTISNSPTVVCSEETFTRVTGEQSYLMVNVILAKDATETTVNEIHSLIGENTFLDRRQENSESYGSYWVLRLAAYGFLAIISLITVLNIMNSISMSVTARIKQYGAMRAVGMEHAQVTRMITAEAVTYAVCGLAVGTAFGLLLHYVFYKIVIITHFGGSWNIPVIPLAVILLLVLISCVLAVYSPAKRMRNMEITDTINAL